MKSEQAKEKAKDRERKREGKIGEEREECRRERRKKNWLKAGNGFQSGNESVEITSLWFISYSNKNGNGSCCYRRDEEEKNKNGSKEE